MTHQAPANRFSLFSRMVSVATRIFCDGGKDGTYGHLYENNDHLFGRGLVGQYHKLSFAWSKKKFFVVPSFEEGKKMIAWQRIKKKLRLTAIS